MEQEARAALIIASDKDMAALYFNKTARIWSCNDVTVIATPTPAAKRTCPICGVKGTNKTRGWECTLICYSVPGGAGRYPNNRKYHCERMETGTIPLTPLWFCRLGCMTIHCGEQTERRAEQIRRTEDEGQRFQDRLYQNAQREATLAFEEHGWLAPDGTFSACLYQEHVDTIVSLGFQSEGAAQSRGYLRLRWYKWEDPRYADGPPLTQNQINFIAEHAERHEKEIPTWLKAFLAQQSLY